MSQPTKQRIHLKKYRQIKIYLNDTSNKIGISFIKNETDSDLWERLLMLHRSKFKMPSTTNSIESIHDHLNECTSIKNFVSSFHLLL